MFNRNEIIEYGYKNRYSVEDTNSALAKDGQRPMGPREEGLYRTKRFNTTPLERFKKDAKEFASGINTIGTMAVDYGYNLLKDPSKTINSTLTNVGNYLGDKGPIGTAKDIGSLLGSPYGLTEEDIKTRGLGNVLRTAPGYAWSHPGYTTLDFVLPAMGKVPKHQIGDLLERINAPVGIRQFIPSTNISKVNEAINSTRGVVGVSKRNMQKLLSSVADMKDVDMGQVARNLQAPKGSVYLGNTATIEATKKMKDIATRYDKELQALGIDPKVSKALAQAQYVLEKVNPTRSSELVVDDILRHLKGEKVNLHGVNKETIDALASRAGKLYDEGVITPLSHRATFKTNTGRPGLVTDLDRAKGNLAERRYGQATPEQLGPTLFKAYEDTAKEIYDANMGRLSVENIAKSVGKRTTLEQLAERPLLDDEILISPRAYNAQIKQDFRAGDFATTNRRIRNLVEDGIPEKLREAYKDDLWIVKKDNLRPLKNMVETRTTNSWLRRPMGMWKTAQLVTPKYVIENRLGNWALNSIEGVKFEDYLDALDLKIGGEPIHKGRFADIQPDRLKADTSYYGVLGEDFRGTRAMEAFKKATGVLWEGFKERDAGKLARGLYDTPSSFILAGESQLENLERYANFIRQAKRMAEETGESVENIIKRSSTDRLLYDKLMGQVNRSLGDYIGRNWSIDPRLYEGLSTAFPFFKYPTQAVRTLAYQAMNRPFNFYSRVTLPERIGAEKWNQLVAQYPELEDYEGGLVDHKQLGKYGFLHLHQLDTHPLGAGAGLLASALGDWQNVNISPFFSLSRIPNFQDRFGNTASSPKYYNAGGQTFVRDPRTGLPMRELARPNFGDRAQYLTSWYANNFLTPVIAWNRYLGPIVVAGMDRVNDKFKTNLDATWYPNYDTSILGQIGEGKIPSWLQPVISGKTDRPGRRYPDTVLNQLGVRTLKVYPKQSASARSYQMAIKKYRRNQFMKKFKED